jgi:predicted nucleic acid-binding protein
MFPLVLPTEPALDRALSYAYTYTLSHWDSMLVAACAESGISTLYTEDMGAPRKIDTVELINPF